MKRRALHSQARSGPIGSRDDPAASFERRRDLFGARRLRQAERERARRPLRAPRREIVLERRALRRGLLTSKSKFAMAGPP